MDHAWPAAWWTLLGDPVLDALQQRAPAASPDLRTAALRHAQSREQRGAVAAQQGPQVRANAGAVRQRQSEQGAGTRMLDAIGGDRECVAKTLAQPFTLYQAGVDASWELDLWGRVRHAVEAADADVAAQAALLDLARLSLAGDLARYYIELRTTQAQLGLARQDIGAQQERLALMQARVAGGALEDLALERPRADLAAAHAQLPPLLAQEAAASGQIELLLGERPGALHATLAARPEDAAGVRAQLPDLSLGLPSEAAQRRPDTRAAEARLRRATANIGVARADLYPSIRIGARAGLESYRANEFGEWGSRTWSIGPSLDIPLFDHGRRTRVLRLRQLEQQEAAVAYQRSVLQAWHEIDDALNGYAAERAQLARLRERKASAAQTLGLAQARHSGGMADYTPVLDSRRAALQARRESLAAQGRAWARFLAINRALALYPDSTEPEAAAVSSERLGERGGDER